MGKFESYPSINSLSDDDISLYNHDTVTHKINFARLAELIKTKVSESIPTQGSDNLVTSGGIYSAIKANTDSKADKATTLEGYGITNAYNMVEANARFTPKYSIDSSGWDNAPTASSTNPVVSNGVYEAIRDATADMVGATASADGTHGLVPKPLAGDENKVLKGDGTWGDSVSSISTLTDVDLTNISDGQLLRYNSTLNKWENVGVDSTPTQNSTHPVSSGGVYTSLGEKQSTYSADSTQWDTTPTTSSTKPVTSGGVKDAIDTVNGDKANQTVIATRQTNLVAVKEYEIGEQFIYNNTLYKADAVINQNGTITIGGNASLADDISSQISNLANQLNFSITSMNLSRSTLPTGSGVSIGTLPAGGVYLVSVNLRLQSGTFGNGVIISPCDGIVQNNHDYGQHFCIASGGSSIVVYNYSGSQLTLHSGSNIKYIKLK